MRELIRPSSEAHKDAGGSEPTARPRRRLTAALVALTLSTAGIGFVIRTFREATRPVHTRPVAAMESDRIVFAAYTDHNWQIFSIDSDAGEATRLTDLPTNQSHPTWSPDGTKIAFSMQGERGDTEIASMNADGSDVQTLTGGAGWNYLPAWSPNGSRIAFVSNRDGNDEIYVMNADGTDQERLTDEPGEDLAPTWSPDGERIAFGSNRASNSEIYVMNADGTGVTNLTNAPATGEYDPAWSPDGTRIAFAGIRDGNPEIYVMAADGSDVVRLTNSPAHDWNPAWSPDGTRLAFESDPDGTVAPFVVDANGGRPTALIDWGAEACCAAWQPQDEPVQASGSPGDGTLSKAATIPIAHDAAVAGAIEVGGDAVWVTLYRWTDEVMRGAIVRVDPATDIVATEIPIDDGVPTDLAITRDRVWVLVQTSSTHVELRAIDPGTDAFVATVEVPANHAGPLTATDDALWLAALEVPPGGSWSDATRSIVRLDGTTGEVVAQIPAEVCQVNDSNCTPTRAVVADGSVWFEGNGRTALFRVDPSTNDVQRIPKDAWCGFAVGGGSIWVGQRQPGLDPETWSNAPYLMQEIDETNGAVVGDPILVEGGQPDPITGSACPLAVGDGGVWVEGYDREMNHVLIGRVSVESRMMDVGLVIADGEIAPRLVFDFSTGTMWASEGQDLIRYEMP
jgi:dipeptidyl aminopeptidase/acylaminoacyl peptidase